MRVFDHPNMTSGFTCPICGTGDDKQVVLIGIHGTKEGNIMAARQYHLDCLNLNEYAGKDADAYIIMSFTPKEAL